MGLKWVVSFAATVVVRGDLQEREYPLLRARRPSLEMAQAPDTQPVETNNEAETPNEPLNTTLIVHGCLLAFMVIAIFFIMLTEGIFSYFP